MGIIGIIGAMASEVELLVQQMEEGSVLRHAGLEFHYGLLAGKPAVVVRCGIGKVNAAACAQILADEFGVTHVVNTGVAGSLDNRIEIGDVVVSTDAVHHDMDVTGLGYAPGEVPQVGTVAFPANDGMRERAVEACRQVVPEIGVFEGRVVLGNGVRVGAYSVIRNTTVEDDVEILPFCHFEGAAVGRDSCIGPYSRLRPGAELTGNNHIGNFVEVKKSVIGQDSKVNHLTYIGDADVGARVNVGAGTITCNYDGVNKFRTVIGDDAFIGSDTQLIAPVEVGAGATIGAGTTLTRNAPAGKLTLSRARQMTIEGWTRPVKKQ